MKNKLYKKISISLDKLDQEFLNSLKLRTGKSEEEILKLALNELYQDLVKNSRGNNQQPVTIPNIFVQPPTPYVPVSVPDPTYPYSPVTPVTPINPPSIPGITIFGNIDQTTLGPFQPWSRTISFSNPMSGYIQDQWKKD